MDKTVIGFMGLAGAGKTTTAKIIQEIDTDRIGVYSFARPLKKFAGDLFMLSCEQLYGNRKEDIDERWGVSPRRIMQIVGTECVRNMIMPDFWVARMKESIKRTSYEIILIDDVRFQDEAQMVIDVGGCNYLIQRPGGQQLPWHASEQPPVQLAEDTFYNQVSLDEYQIKVRQSEPYRYIEELLGRPTR